MPLGETYPQPAMANEASWMDCEMKKTHLNELAIDPDS